MYKQLIIARKDLGMSPGKLAAQVSHGSMAFIANIIRANKRKVDATQHAVFGQEPVYAFDKHGNKVMEWPGDFTDEDGVLLYRRGDLYHWAREAYAQGRKYFYCRPVDPSNPYGELELCDPDPYYDVNFSLDADLMEQWFMGAFTKVVCEAKNKNQLMKAVLIAEANGMSEGKDFFLIRDNCLTELTPEDEDGRTLTVIGFAPMDAEKIDVVSKKFQLWRD